jgi:hypothetical protein
MRVTSDALEKDRALIPLLRLEDRAIGDTSREQRDRFARYVQDKLRSIVRKNELLMSQAESRIQQVSALQPNWDGYGAPAPNQTAIQITRRILSLLEPYDLSHVSIVPSVEGGVAICFVREDRYADIESLNSGELLGVRYVGRSVPALIRIKGTEASIRAALEEIRNHISG